MSAARRLKKRLGQHHLIRPEACRPLIEFLAPARRRVVEIGPGGGVLTEQLQRAGALVDALEIDPEWAFGLLELGRTRGGSGLRIVVADAMEMVLSRWPPGSMIAGNLPYQIATALIESLLPLHETFPRAAFLVQKEVAERLTARPGSRAYGALTVVTRASAHVEFLGQVRRGAFRPPPKVEGAFVGFELHPPPPTVEEMGGFAATVRLAFSQRRKKLRNSLAGGWGRQRTEKVLELACLDSGARAEELTKEDFFRLHEAATRLQAG